MATTLRIAGPAAPAAAGPPEEALWYARTLGWPVHPGPGDERAAAATSDPARVRLLWAGPGAGAPVRLATGPRFDVLDVPGAAGARALRRAEALGVPLGPVAATADGRLLFLVAPGVAADLPAILDWLDWGGLGLDLRAHGDGGGVPAPAPWPAVWAGPWPRPGEDARWLRPPVPARSGARAARSAALPAVDVRGPDVTWLVGALADACQHARLSAPGPLP